MAYITAWILVMTVSNNMNHAPAAYPPVYSFAECMRLQGEVVRLILPENHRHVRSTCIETKIAAPVTIDTSKLTYTR